jgi:hypothetical protein
LLLIVATTRATWADYKDSPPPTRDERIIAQLEANAPEIAASGGKAVLVRTGDNLEIEAIATSTYRLELDGTYQFVNLRSEAPVQFAIDRPVLFYGVVMSLLVNPNGFPSFCENTYFVDPELMPQFLERTGDDDDRCGHPLHAVGLVS